MNEIRAIPTFYNGIQFKSKLEAFYAKTFDSLGIVWIYEVNGYYLGETKYLPDFWLSGINTYLEVKGPTILGAEKVTELASAIDKQNNDWWNPETIVVIANERGEVRLASDNTIATA